jgi:hypothetical protein
MINFKFEGFSRKYKKYSQLLQKPQYRSFIFNKISKYCIKFPQITINEDINVFKQLATNELQHSKIIGSILNPKEKHGHGDKFLQLFFEIVLNDSDFIYDQNDKWIITVEKSRYDVRIRNQINSKIIIIENKSNEADDGDNQLYRYWYNGIYQLQNKFDSLKPYAKILYLSPGDWKKPDEQTSLRPENYPKNLRDSIPEDIVKIVYYPNEIVSWLLSCMNVIDKSSDMYYYLKQYVDCWRT